MLLLLLLLMLLLRLLLLLRAALQDAEGFPDSGSYNWLIHAYANAPSKPLPMLAEDVREKDPRSDLPESLRSGSVCCFDS